MVSKLTLDFISWLKGILKLKSSLLILISCKRYVPEIVNSPSQYDPLIS